MFSGLCNINIWYIQKLPNRKVGQSLFNTFWELFSLDNHSEATARSHLDTLLVTSLYG